jgi:Tfp pilus assembly protein PilZ
VKRIPVRFEAGGMRGQGHVKNLSKGGLFIRSHLLPLTGDPIDVRFETPGGRQVQVSGTVRWTTAERSPEDPPGFGLEIEKPGREYLAFFEDLLYGG